LAGTVLYLSGMYNQPTVSGASAVATNVYGISQQFVASASAAITNYFAWYDHTDSITGGASVTHKYGLYQDATDHPNVLKSTLELDSLGASLVVCTDSSKVLTTSGCSTGSGTVTTVGSADGSITVTNPTTTPDLSVVKAPKLTTARSITATSDISWTVNFDGSANVSAVATIANNAVTNAKAAQAGANTVSGNFTGSTANKADNSVPSCSTTNNFLQYTSGTGLSCGAATGGGGGGVGTVTTTGSPASPQVAIFSGSTSITGANIAGVPQGRLTGTSGAPVMTSDNSAITTIYYDCYNGIAVNYYDGTTDAADNITSCELSDALPASSTGVVNSGDVFDEFYDHVSGKICHATNGSGGGWASDTGGSTTARGTGYSQLENVRGYWTNKNSITHCYAGSTDKGSLGADKATYLGSFYTTSAGTTKMQFLPAAASGGSNCFLGIWNAYNQVTSYCRSEDTAATYNYTTNAWRAFDNNNNNRVTWVDGLGQSLVRAFETTSSRNTGSGNNNTVNIALDATSNGGGTGGFGTLDNGCVFEAQATQSVPISCSATTFTTPKIGLHYYQLIESNNGGGSWKMNYYPTILAVELRN
jgi:hypothetical protein